VWKLLISIGKRTECGMEAGNRFSISRLDEQNRSQERSSFEFFLLLRNLLLRRRLLRMRISSTFIKLTVSAIIIVMDG